MVQHQAADLHCGLSIIAAARLCNVAARRVTACAAPAQNLCSLSKCISLPLLFIPCSYHVVPGVAAASTDLVDGQVLPTLLGQNITVSIGADGVSLISANPAVPAAKVIQARKREKREGEGMHASAAFAVRLHSRPQLSLSPALSPAPCAGRCGLW